MTKEITINNIAGTLTLPDTPKATILFLHSSERSHRDEDYFKELADYALSQDIATFRYDSPGAGKSTGNSFMQSFDDRANECIEIYHHLKDDLKLPQIGISGLSEGAIISFMAVKKLKDCKFLAPVSFDPVGFDSFRLLNEMKEEGFKGTAIEKAEAWLAYMGVHTVDANNLPESLSFEKEALLKQSKESAEQQLKRCQLAYSRDIESCGDWPHMSYVLSDIVDKKLTPEQFSKNKRIWQEFCTLNPLELYELWSGPTLAIWGEKDPYLNTLEIQKSLNCDSRIYKGVGHSIENDNGFDKAFFQDLCTWILEL